MNEEKCENCSFFSNLVSHPLVDGKPMTNVIGSVCLVFIEDNKNAPVVMCRKEGSCECFKKR